MIIKYFELKKKKIDNYKFFLLYGNNIGLIQDTIEKYIKTFVKGNIYNYEENEIIKREETFIESISNKSFFDEKKLIIISRVTDKIYKIIQGIIDKKIDDIILVLTTGVLEKKSKIRNFFEKDKKTVCIPFYEDNVQSLNSLAQDYLKDKKIFLSQQTLNLITDRCRGDRINLFNELNKIENFAKNKKKINHEDILKLTNLSENFSINELVDNTLAKNVKRTLNILNENNFSPEDSILIIRIFLNKLKRLLKIKLQMEENKNNVDNAIDNFKPPIFWKDKIIVKKQIEILDNRKIQKLIYEVNNLELQIKKYPLASTNIITNFVIDQTNRINN